jgi:hypothetical protein
MINIPLSNRDRDCEIYISNDHFYSLYYDFGIFVLLSVGCEFLSDSKTNFTRILVTKETFKTLTKIDTTKLEDYPIIM